MKQRPYMLRHAGAELLGTYAFVTTGCGAILVRLLFGCYLGWLLAWVATLLPLPQPSLPNVQPQI